MIIYSYNLLARYLLLVLLCLSTLVLFYQKTLNFLVNFVILKFIFETYQLKHYNLKKYIGNFTIFNLITYIFLGVYY